MISSRGFESFSYAALESLAAGRPVIATATGALPEIIEHEKTGLIVPSTDPRAMASAMERLLEDRTYSEQLGATGFEAARQRYHTPHVLPQILQTYEDATNFYVPRAVGAVGADGAGLAPGDRRGATRAGPRKAERDAFGE